MFAKTIFPMMPRAILSSLLLTAFSTAAFSQQVDKPETQKETIPKFAAGVRTGNALSHVSSGSSSYFTRPDISPTISVGLFARYYLGKHFAIEAGANILSYKKQQFFGSSNFTIVETVNGVNYQYRPETVVKPTTIEIPLEFQYHIGKRSDKLRPYFGLGAGYCINRYELNFQYNRIDGSGTRGNETFIDNDNTVQLNFTQGLTYQVTPKLQLNQSFRYGLSDINTISLNFGVGYTIGK